MSSFDQQATYFWREGKPNLNDCLRISFEAAKRECVQKIVIFTGMGLGVNVAIDEYLSQGQYSHIQIVAVTFPPGQQFTHPDHRRGIPEADQKRFSELGIPIVRAHMPFEPIKAQYQGHGILGQDFSLIGNVLSIFGGSMSLCVQAVLMACDAGVVRMGEHVIALTSDTSILARSAPTSHLLTDFVVRQIFCKPVLLTVGKNEKVEPPSSPAATIEGGKVEEWKDPLELPSEGV